MNEVIKESKVYVLEVGPSMTNETTLCYRIVNKRYNVVEIETFLLPQAIKYLDDLEAGLAAVTDMTPLPKINFEA